MECQTTLKKGSSQKKLRRAAARIPHEVDHQLVNLGLRAGDRDYVKFIILTRGRTGSNLLLSALEQHSNVLAYGELFSRPGRVRWDRKFGVKRQEKAQLAVDEPGEFVTQTIFRKYPSKLKAVGFKLFYHHAREEPGNKLWPYLRDDGDLRIIHLRRRNLLKMVLSAQVAFRSGKWYLIDSNSKKQTARFDKSQPIRLDYDACLQEFEKTRALEEQCGEYFFDHPTINLWYERLVQDYPEQIGMVQDFLQLEPEPLVPLTKKQAKLPLDKQIENYAELKERFANSEWAEFFEV